jgi:hypothetical protein
VGPLRLTEVRFKPGRKLTAYYEAFVNTKNPKGNYVRAIAVASYLGCGSLFFNARATNVRKL